MRFLAPFFLVMAYYPSSASSHYEWSTKMAIKESMRRYAIYKIVNLNLHSDNIVSIVVVALLSTHLLNDARVSVCMCACVQLYVRYTIVNDRCKFMQQLHSFTHSFSSVQLSCSRPTNNQVRQFVVILDVNATLITSWTLTSCVHCNSF